MTTAELIEHLETYPSDTLVVVRRYDDHYRAPAWDRTTLVEETAPNIYRDMCDQERDRDQLAIVL
ncbi:hypothetical protein [Psychromarinibacter sp. S121]|uniref:hypothetical protein n=1 Tax=Psychromarinibacter sp. S121 TaxID=3415127 RepID=UPI003C7E9D26